MHFIVAEPADGSDSDESAAIEILSDTSEDDDKDQGAGPGSPASAAALVQKLRRILDANKRERDEVLGAMREEGAGIGCGSQPPGDARGSCETPGQNNP
jgi:hypothetical protein